MASCSKPTYSTLSAATLMWTVAAAVRSTLAASVEIVRSRIFESNSYTLLYERNGGGVRSRVERKSRQSQKSKVAFIST